MRRQTKSNTMRTRKFERG
jgi:hypothetical protein